MPKIDHDLLIALHEDIKWLKNGFKNHLSHHFYMTIAAFSTAAAAFTTLIVVLIKG